MQFFGNGRQHDRFVDVRHSHVDVENVCTGFHLGDALAEDVVKILLHNGLFQPLFAGRIDAFSDDAHAVNRYKAGRRADAGNAGRCRRRTRCVSVEHLTQCADKRRVGAAASAHHADAKRQIFLHAGGELVGVDRVEVGLWVGKSCICFDEDRK